MPGGFDFDATGWEEKDRLRMLAIALAKNNVKFHKLPNGTVGSWPHTGRENAQRAKDGSESP